MTLRDVLSVWFAVILISLAWRTWIRPLPGQTLAFLLMSSAIGSAVGVFAGLLIGGAGMSDQPVWVYLACPSVAVVLTTRLQGLAIDWIGKRE